MAYYQEVISSESSDEENKDLELTRAAEAYVEAVMEEFKKVEEGEELSEELESILKLGFVFMRKNDDGKWLMSPLHPLNILYQLELQKEDGWDTLAKHSELIQKLTPLNLIPYIRNEERQLCRTIEQRHSPEWRYYGRFEQERYSANRMFIPKLICEKIFQYKKHFPFLFDTVDNYRFNINLINMGDCRAALEGITRFFLKMLDKERNNKDVFYPKFIVSVYGECNTENEFQKINNIENLKYFVDDFVSADDIDTKNKLITFLSSNIAYFEKGVVSDKDIPYAYAHLSFYEMPSRLFETRTVNSSKVPTGISLNGFISSIPSVKSSKGYSTGFGRKYAGQSRLTEMASYYNDLHHVSINGDPFQFNQSLCTRLSSFDKNSLDKIFNSSNWVTFIAPQVDLAYFESAERKNAKSSETVMIIHYSDQYTSSSGYDDITVTNKSQQYCDIVEQEFRKRLGNDPDYNKLISKNTLNIIKAFNAINGSWLLKLVATEKNKGDLDSTFSREKMSILSAIKVCKEYFKDDDVVWVPISLEELLRVSGNTGYSQIEGILSAKNLAFDKGAKSDDLLMIGITEIEQKLHISLVPVEVKIGSVDHLVLEKAITQVTATFDGLMEALRINCSKLNIVDKLIRDFFMQHIIVCCEKYYLYSDPEDKTRDEWKCVTDQWRQKLLNHEFEITDKWTRNRSIIPCS